MAKIDLTKINVVSKSSTENNNPKNTNWNFLNKDIQLFGSTFSDKKKERFYSELCILFSAGVDIRATLELIEEEQTKEKDRAVFTKIKDAIIAGSSFSKAIEKTRMFTSYEYYSLQIGEESGRLKEVLQELSTFYSKKIQQKRLLISALSYPAVVFSVAIAVVFFMMKFVVPMFSDQFKRIKGDLPYFTKLIVKGSDIVTNYSLYFFMCIVIIGFVLYTQRKAIWFRKLVATILLRTPVIGEMISKIYLARFCQSMNLLINAKTPLVTAIELVKKMVGFYPIEVSLDEVQEDLMKGKSLSTSLAKFKMYNKRMISLLKVAEEVNQLDVIFAKLAKQYADEVEYQTTVMGNLIEPIMIVFLGIFIGIILIAMYLPLFQMSTTVG